MFPHVIPEAMPHLSEPLLPHLCRKDMETGVVPEGSELESPVLWMLPGFSLTLCGTHRLARNWGAMALLSAALPCLVGLWSQYRWHQG